MKTNNLTKIQQKIVHALKNACELLGELITDERIPKEVRDEIITKSKEIANELEGKT
jgi:uncharacterized protein (UPF0147 family)